MRGRAASEAPVPVPGGAAPPTAAPAAAGQPAAAGEPTPAPWPGAHVVLVTGGARSGKSRFALDLAAGCRAAVYLATAEPLDEEMRRRIERHRAERGDEWVTVEEPVDLAGALDRLPPEAEVAVVDCLTVWLGNLVHRAVPAAGLAAGDPSPRHAVGSSSGAPAASPPAGVAASPSAVPPSAGASGRPSPVDEPFGEGAAAAARPAASPAPDLADPAAFPEIAAFLARLEAPPCPLVLVTNEVGWGIVPDNPLARAFRDLAGRVNEEVARRAGRVVLMVAGRPLELPGGCGG